MKLASPILEVLKRKGIKKPTPIQMQGLTVVRTWYLVVCRILYVVSCVVVQCNEQ